jgi:hypothetical protein
MMFGWRFGERIGRRGKKDCVQGGIFFNLDTRRV